MACQKPDCAIQLSEFSPPDGRYLKAGRVVVIPNGLADQYVVHGPRKEEARETPRILFVGALRRSKGIGILLEACSQLKRRGLRFELECMGEFDSRAFEAEMRGCAEAGGVSENVRFLGRRTAEDKWRTYLEADVLCLPTFHEVEGLPLVVLEAMQFRLPVVATQWRGIPSLVRDGETGYLVPPRDPAALADRLGQLLQDAALRRVMGEKARQRFLAEFTIERWRDRMEQAILGVA
jgi:glycosyltransferase involved in cell wall biosynthesis